MKKNLLFQFLLTGAASIAMLGLATATLRADQHVQVAFEMPVHVHGKVYETGCNNSGGPEVTLDGAISLGGVKIQLIFQNNLKGTHTTTVTYSTNVVLLPLGTAVTIPKQPVLGGVGGNPHIWIQFDDGKGTNLTDEIYLGRCVQGLSISPSFLNDVLAAADIQASDCSNRKGPYITLGGSLRFSGLHARFIFRNNLKGTHTAEVMRDVEIIAEGSTVTIPKQPVRGGAGGNPLISVRFLQGNGEPITDPVLLGRCTQF